MPPAAAELVERMLGLSLTYSSTIPVSSNYAGKKKKDAGTFLRPNVLSTATLGATFACSFFFGGIELNERGDSMTRIK